MTNKSESAKTSPKGAVELKEDALDKASGGWLAQEVGGAGLESFSSPGASKINQKVLGLARNGSPEP